MCQKTRLQIGAEYGLQPMADEVAIGALPLVMNLMRSRDRGGCRGLALVGRDISNAGALRIVDDLLPKRKTSGGRRQNRTSLRSCPAEKRRDMLFDHVAGASATVMGMPPTGRSIRRPASSNSAWTR